MKTKKYVYKRIITKDRKIVIRRRSVAFEAELRRKREKEAA